ncbi:coth protein-domain-containing protein [Neocallimastix sp. 'constans']|jgi:spore coat protein CotH
MASLLLLILFIANVLFANAEVSFKVIAINDKPKVVINNKHYEMTEYEYPVYNATIDVDPPVKYHYILGDSEEDFDRVVDGHFTLNDFFNREHTVIQHPLLPLAYNESALQKKSKLYDDTFVATVLIDVTEDDLEYLYNNSNVANIKYENIKVIYVSPYTVKNFNNAKFGLSGQSTLTAAKLSYKLTGLKTDDNKELFGRTSIKLRAEHMDPTLIREKIYIDILNSLGVPTAQGTFARVFINKKDVGLFLISDDLNNGHFIKNTFNNGKKFTEDNHIFKASYNRANNYMGNLQYYGPTSENYDCYTYMGDLEDVDKMAIIEEVLVPLLRDIDQYPTTKQLNLNVDDFIKYMAMEFLSYASDNYWLIPGNFFAIKDVAKDYWYFLDEDFHISFGLGISPIRALNSTLDTYSEFGETTESYRALLDKVRQIPENEQFLKDVLKRLINTSFNIHALEPRIDSIVKLIQQDAEWDYDLLKVNNNYSEYGFYNYTYDDFVNQVTESKEINYPVPIKTWIIERSEIVAEQLGFEVPEEVDNSLGSYEPKYANIEESDITFKNNTMEINGALPLNLKSVHLNYYLFMIFIVLISIFI